MCLLSSLWLTVFARYGSGDLKDSVGRERTEFYECQGHIPFQIGEPFNQPRVHRSSFGASAQQQHDRRRTLCPLPPQVLEEIQSRFVRPLEIIDKNEQG